MEILRKLSKGLRHLPNLLRGYNIYVNPHKLHLIDRVFGELYPGASSFADLGGVWRVNAAYTRYTLGRFPIQRAVLVDTDFPPGLRNRLAQFPHLELVEDDFGKESVCRKIGPVDVVYFFDVLLHQVNPDWDEILTRYAAVAPCMVIYNQQYIRGEQPLRLTDLPLEQYMELAPRKREELYRHVYEHAQEIHPQYGKPWKDIHNIWQWGITDQALREVMQRLGYREVYFHNYGQFSNLTAFEDHAFVFIKDR